MSTERRGWALGAEPDVANACRGSQYSCHNHRRLQSMNLLVCKITHAQGVNVFEHRGARLAGAFGTLKELMSAVGRSLTEAHGVRQDDLPPARQPRTPQRRVERLKQPEANACIYTAGRIWAAAGNQEDNWRRKGRHASTTRWL